MSHLLPCPSCNRHVDAVETACPFCAASLPASFRATASAVPPPRRLARAALMAAGATLMSAAACNSNDAIGSGTKDATPTYDGPRAVPFYGGPFLGTGGTTDSGATGAGGSVATGRTGGSTDAGKDGPTDAGNGPARDASQDRRIIAIYGAAFAGDKPVS